MNIFIKSFLLSLAGSLVVFSFVFYKSKILPQRLIVHTNPLPMTPIGNGDADSNGVVDFKDLNRIAANWQNKMSGSVDQYQDGKINSLDFTVSAFQLKQK